jgi:hypothetical protein
MKTKSLIATAALLAALLISGALIVNTEASGNDSGYNIYILILGIIEDPDPIPTITYKTNDVDDDPLFDAGAGLRDDGRPATAYSIDSGWPQVTWATSGGDDYDIAFSGWNGTSWSGTEQVTTSPDNELDPRVHIDSFQKTYIVYWVAGSPDKVFLTTRTGGALSWKNQGQVANDARRPSVVTHDEQLLIAFERELADGGQEVMVARIEGEEDVTAESVASTPRSERLDAVIHSSGGLLWVDWKHSDSEFAYSILERTGWSDPVTISWNDKSWVGEETIRQVIKTEVLSP